VTILLQRKAGVNGVFGVLEKMFSEMQLVRKRGNADAAVVWAKWNAT